MPVPEKGSRGFRPRLESLQNYSDLAENAKETAVALLGDMASNDVIGIFYETKLESVETGIRRLNEFSSKCWLISAISLYTMIYDQMLYQQSGLKWEEYIKESKKRLGMDSRDIAEALSSARFFLKYHKELQRAKWNPVGSGRKLARAELAVELSGSVKETIRHLASDTWIEFKTWYSSFKLSEKLPPVDDNPRNDIDISRNGIFIGGEKLLEINKKIPVEEQRRLKEYLSNIYTMIKAGYEPAIIAVYDKKEARHLEHLRDKDRQNR
jgi:hypothetical protein